MTITRDKLLELTRYDPAHGSSNGWDNVPPAIMEQSETGDYVAYADVAALLSEAQEGEPVAYLCPADCGCWWRDNKDGTMSLFNGDQKSCATCEALPLKKLSPVSIADHLFIEARGDGRWHVCVEKVYASEDDARKSCRKWKEAYAKLSTPPSSDQVWNETVNAIQSRLDSEESVIPRRSEVAADNFASGLRSGLRIALDILRKSPASHQQSMTSEYASFYKYLRERNINVIDQGGIFAGMTPENLVLTGDDLDNAIRSAINSSSSLKRPSQAQEQDECETCTGVGTVIDPETEGLVVWKLIPCPACKSEPSASGAVGEQSAQPSKVTDLSHRLRETADQQPGWKALLTAAADEIERYYGGMLAWKQTAEKKDRDWNEERMGRMNDRISALSRVQVAPEGWKELSDLSKEMDAFVAKWKTCSITELNYYAKKLRSIVNGAAAPSVNEKGGGK